MPAAKPRNPKKLHSSPASSNKVYYDADNDYFRKHLANLVREHGGEWVIIANGKLIGTGKKHQIGTLLSKARISHPQSTPFIAPIPTKDELECAL